MENCRENNKELVYNLNSELRNKGGKKIDDLELSHFKFFIRTDRNFLIKDLSNYYFMLIQENCYYEHVYYLNQMWKEKVDYFSSQENATKDILNKEVFSSLVELIVKNEGITSRDYLAISQLFQCRIYVRKSDAFKTKIYEIENSFYNFYLLELKDRIVILEPFDMRYEWENGVLDASITHIGYILNNCKKEHCKKCKKTTSTVYCRFFHDHCYECLEDIFCRQCPSRKDTKAGVESPPFDTFLYLFVSKKISECVNVESSGNTSSRKCELCNEVIHSRTEFCSFCSDLYNTLLKYPRT